jgi:transcription elongation factor GreA
MLIKAILVAAMLISTLVLPEFAHAQETIRVTLVGTGTPTARPERLAIADDSNLAENSEYQAARADQDFNDARIAELEDKLARLEVIDVSKLSGDTIRFGATATLIDEDSGEQKVWQIVGEPEADANKGKISVTSPVARALIGRNKGDTVEVEAPGGAKSYKIRKVEWLENDPLK